MFYADLYLGDAGSSVASLFSVMEKPLFILDQKVSSFREEGDSRMHDLLQYFLLKAAKGNPEELDETLVFEGRFLLHASIQAIFLFLRTSTEKPTLIRGSGFSVRKREIIFLF